MDAHLFIDAVGDGDRRHCRHGHQAHDSAGSPLSEIGTALGWFAFQLEISCVSVRTCWRFDRVLWHFNYHAATYRPGMSPHSDTNWILTDVCRRPLFVRCSLRSSSGVPQCGTGQLSTAEPISSTKH